MCVYVCVSSKSPRYIYIYIYIYSPRYIYIYIYIFSTRATHWMTTGEYQAGNFFKNSVWFVTFVTLTKISLIAELCLMLQKYCRTFSSSSYKIKIYLFRSYSNQPRSPIFSITFYIVNLYFVLDLQPLYPVDLNRLAILRFHCHGGSFSETN